MTKRERDRLESLRTKVAELEQKLVTPRKKPGRKPAKGIQVQVDQGGLQWHQLRAGRYGSSDAPVLMGVSPYRKTLDEDTKIPAFLSQRGHNAENAMRPVGYKPAVFICDRYGVPLIASLDGWDGVDSSWEHKLSNKGLVALAQKKRPRIPLHFLWQCVHQLLVVPEMKVLELEVSNGETSVLKWGMKRCNYTSQIKLLLHEWKEYHSKCLTSHQDVVY